MLMSLFMQAVSLKEDINNMREQDDVALKDFLMPKKVTNYSQFLGTFFLWEYS